MSVTKDTVAQAATSYRSAREALERWMAEADALLAGKAETAVVPAEKVA